MSPTPTDSPYRWRAADLEGIRIALSIPARLPAVRAINEAMTQLEEQYPDAIPTARVKRHPLLVLRRHENWST